MIVIATISLVVLLLGLGVYFATSHKTLGLVMFGCGPLVVLAHLGSHVFRLG